MSSYFVALINIHDTALYDQYLAGFDSVFERYQGQVVAVDDQPRVLEGDWPAGRTVLIRFPDDQALLRWYESSEYQDIARYRKDASVGSVAMVTGRDG